MAIQPAQTSDPLDLFNRDPLGIMNQDPLGIIPEQEKPSLFKRGGQFIEGLARVRGALTGGLVAFPVSGVRAAWELGFGEGEFEDRLFRAGKKIEEITSIPMKLLQTPEQQKTVEIVAKPLEWIETAGRFYGDKAYEKWGDPDVAASTKTAFETIVFFGLPKLFGKFKARLRANKIEGAKEVIREVHRERLKRLRAEPKRLQQLAAAEKRLANERYLEKFRPEGYKEPLVIEAKPQPEARIKPDVDYTLRKGTEATGGTYRPGLKRPVPRAQQDLQLRQYGEKLAKAREEMRIHEQATQDLIELGKRITEETYRYHRISPAERSAAVFQKESQIIKSPQGRERLRQSLTEQEKVKPIKEPATWRKRKVTRGGMQREEHILKGRGSVIGDKKSGYYPVDKTGEIIGEGEVVKPLKTLGDAKKVVESGTTLSFLGTQNAYNQIAKHAPKLKRFGQVTHDLIDVEARFNRMGASETGFHAKNFFSLWSMVQEQGLDIARRIGKLGRYKKQNFGVDTVLGAESKTKLKTLNPEQKLVAEQLLKYFDESKQYYHSKGVKIDFKKRIINELESLLEEASDADVPAIEAALKTARDMNFVHIPSAMWFESKLSTPEGAKAVLRILAEQKRKSLNIQSLIDRGLVKPEDVNVFDIVASYTQRLGRDKALIELRDAAIKDKLVYANKKLAPAHYVNAPDNLIVFKGHKIHPILSDYLVDITGRGINLGKFGKWLSLSKMLAFINPGILPMYDTVQHGMLATLNKWGGPAKSNIPFYHLARGAKQYLTRSPKYYEALKHGLSSQPYNNPFQTYRGMVQWAGKSKQQKFMLSALEMVYPHKIVKNIYNASWHLAWEMDKMIRMGSYDLLRTKGHAPRQAAQTAAKFHADYASVPAKTRRIMNVPFFTPTFKVVMGKLYGRMLVDAGKAGGKLWGMLGEVDPTTKTFAKGLIGTVIVNQALNILMEDMLGFEIDQWGRRYKYPYKTESGEQKDLMVTWSHPGNIVQKYIYRAIEANAPEEEKPILDFISSNRWEIHPFWRTIGEAYITNKDPRGGKIYNMTDDFETRSIKRARYITRSIVALIGMFDRSEFDQEGRAQFVKEFGQTLEVAFRPFSFIYTRSTEDTRKYHRIKRFQKEFRKEMMQKIYQGEKFEKDYFKDYEERLNEILND